MWKRETGILLLISQETGTLTQNALIIPCAMTKRVFPRPLKNPMAQKKMGVSRQSIPVFIPVHARKDTL